MNKNAAVWMLASAQNQMAKRVVEYLHEEILKNSSPSQSYRYEDVALALGLDKRKVGLCLAQGGVDRITVNVTAKDRVAIKGFLKRRGLRG